jgi:hypothetical protein
MDLYVNGTTVGSTTPSGLTTTGIISAYFGARFSTTIGAYMPGTIAEAAIWNIALAAADINSLSKGISPLLIHPQNLVMYAPLIRNLQDIKHGYPLINNNAATVATHPKIYKI